jgi:hypothetical protein
LATTVLPQDGGRNLRSLLPYFNNVWDIPLTTGLDCIVYDGGVGSARQVPPIPSRRPPERRGFRGGCWACSGSDLFVTNPYDVVPTYEINTVGFHVATLAPEPHIATDRELLRVLPRAR